ncbi:protein phosphatase [Mangrovactinospora gilvigrisea]|uniref:Serine/threonine protein phosphatase PstP n=1 Tax=Mangrovactinospora gilvigrisea TaxID=1428644 RepID=A0A1J7C6R9_9ACTN|nr:PP2C family serine/threonine-protein phosphatase [Mangrovactinospora gilvigrisea]OIV37256.1 protein phosphatase [Mangrovactinospora gilvigrisea]
MSLTLHFAADSHKGMIREGNEDSGYAGPRLLAIADGMGGQAAGEVASSEVIAVVHRLDEDIPGADLLTALGDAVERANDRLRTMVEEDPQLEGMGCTLTAMLFTGQRVGLVHIGDSRAYLLRDGQLTQITTDHKWVQRLVDEGRISAEEAANHPQRNLLMRALDGKGQAEPDLALREFRVGDRYLLCSDGLSDVVSTETMQETLSGYQPPRETVQELIQLALRAGGPDNITVIVADVLETDAGDTFAGQISDSPQVVGAVADAPPTAPMNSLGMGFPAGRAAGLGRAPEGNTVVGGYGPPDGYGTGPGGATAASATPEPGEQSSAEDGSWEIPPDGRARRRNPWLRRSAFGALALCVLGGAAYGGWRWTQSQYYVGAEDGHVAIYRGVDQSLLGLNLSSVEQSYPTAKLSDLPQYNQQAVKSTIGVSSLAEAKTKAGELEHTADVCRTARAEQADKARQKAAGGDKSGASSGTSSRSTTTAKGTKSPSPSPSASPTLSSQDQQTANSCLSNQP